jgi:predicted RNase H-like HicB family nuclease
VVDAGRRGGIKGRHEIFAKGKSVQLKTTQHNLALPIIQPSSGGSSGCCSSSSNPGLLEKDREILAAAKKIVDQYKIVLERQDGEWYGHALEYPEAMGDGKTVDKCVTHTHEALVASVATMLEEGHTPPAPAREGVRSVQVNIRLTPEEKTSLECRSRAKGYRGLSDFIRATVLSEK